MLVVIYRQFRTFNGQPAQEWWEADRTLFIKGVLWAGNVSGGRQRNRMLKHEAATKTQEVRKMHYIEPALHCNAENTNNYT